MAWWSYRCLENPRPKGGILANGKRHLSISGRTNTSPCPLCPIFVTSVFNLFLFFSSVGACFPRRQKRSKLTLRMPRVSREEFVSCLTKGKPVPALLLLGDEPFLRDASRAQLIETFVPEAARAWAVSRYSADRGETQDALEQAQTLPMLAPRSEEHTSELQSRSDLVCR